MELYHVSPSRNDAGIRQHGILRQMSRCRERLIWLANRRQLDWAVEHVITRHDSPDVTVWIVDVPRSWLQRRGHGPFVCLYDVPEGRIRGRLAVAADGAAYI